MENQDKKVEVEKQVDLDSIKPVESISVDLEKYDKQEATLEKVEVTQVNSTYAETEEKKQWVLKVSSGVLESLGEGEDKIEFRASELFNLTQDDKGNLTGFPTGEGSNLMKFVKDLGVRGVEEFKSLKELVAVMIGKKALIKAYQKEYQGNTRTYLKFRY